MATDLSNLTPETPGTSNLAFSKGSSWGATTAAKILEGLYGADVDWTPLPLQNSWEDYGSPYQEARYCKRAGTVYVEGVIKSGTTTLGTVIATLPEGCRPAATVRIPAMNNTYQDLEADGDIKIGLFWSSGFAAFHFSFYAGA